MQSYEKKNEDHATFGQISGYQLLKLNLNQVNLMSRCGLTVDDMRYVAMYEEYQQMRASGEKVSYIVADLAFRHGVSESTVKRAVRRLSRRVTP